MGFFSEIILLLGVTYSLTFGLEKHSISMLMPNVTPTRPDTWLCFVHPLEKDVKKFVVGFEPKASMKVVHHILLYGCTKPGKSVGVWDCASMSHHVMTGSGHEGHTGMNDNKISSGEVCEFGQYIIYAWAKDAPELELPDGVAFQIGQNTEISHLVLQIHYADISYFEDGATDMSGVIVHYTSDPQPKTAGVILLSTDGKMPPKSKEHFEVACVLDDEDIEIHPFRFRTHTHSLGKLVSGYHVRRDAKGVDQWTRIGKRNPQDAQMFYPVENNVTVRRGDTLAARCTMITDKETWTSVGQTAADEMCNFYIMYWSEKGQLERKKCESSGPPNYYWNMEHNHLNNLPSYMDTD